MTPESSIDREGVAPFTGPASFFRAENPRAVAIIVPAMGTVAGFYRPFAEALAAHELNVLLAELPGTGASRPRPSWKANYGYRDLVEDYLPALVESAREQAEEGTRVILIGHSLGAQAGTLAVAQGFIQVDALITVAGGHIHYRNWDGFSAGKVLFAAALFSSLTYLFGYLPGQYFGFGGPQARSLIREWSRVIFSGSFTHVMNDPEPSGKAPSLCIGFEGDELSPRKSVAGLAVMLDSDLEIMPVNWPGNPHSSWARNPEETVAFIGRWLSAGNIFPGNP